MRSLEQWLAYQAQAHPQPIDLGLERLQRVLERLNWRQPTVPVITVAGTNGKGSVSAYCTSILAAAGYRVGTFTSPHLRDYRERIRIDERVREQRCAAIGHSRKSKRPVWARPGPCEGAPPGGLSLTFFEYNALAAILIFESARLDAWVLEVGMGGRLDAVNVVDPSVAVVVSIGLDHQEFLGSTLEAIAREKAGIFRPGIPAVLGSRDMPPVLESIAQAIGAPLKRFGVEYSYTRHSSRWQLPRHALGSAGPAVAGAPRRHPVPQRRDRHRRLGGARCPSQRAGSGGCARIGRRTAGRTISSDQSGPCAGWRRAWRQRTADVDIGCGPQSRCRASACSEFAGAAECGQDARRVRNPCRQGCAWRRSAAARLHRCVVVCLDARVPRGTSGAALAAELAPMLGVPAAASADIAAACSEALRAAGPLDRIVVFGSFHTVGPALDWLEARGVLPSERLPEYTAPPGGS